MKKKLLFMLINMNVGGTEKALLNMISELPKDKYEITLLMLEEYGGFLESIPDGVRVEYLKGYKKIKEIINRPPHLMALDLFKKGKLINAFSIMMLHLITKLKNERSLFYKYILRNYPVDKTEYDAAIAYAGPMELISYFIVHKVRAKKKIQWIHFDLNKISFNKETASRIFPNFDKIYTVSKEAKVQLDTLLPQLKEKTEVFYSILSSKLMIEEANKEKGFEDKFNGTRILTVGRLTAQKGQDLIPRLLSRLISEGYNIRWYCIGEGNSRVELEKLIKQYDLEENLILLGNKSNPYPYFNQCDLYVQPSRYEGFCITLAEARAFYKPIVITDFVGSEQIANKETGLIVEFDEEQLYGAVKSLLDSEEIRKYLGGNLKRETIDTVTELNKFYKLIN
jgi:glycosyltransferase involved in cell wall biosynthesis